VGAEAGGVAVNRSDKTRDRIEWAIASIAMIAWGLYVVFAYGAAS
jgi:hypothetical protein